MTQAELMQRRGVDAGVRVAVTTRNTPPPSKPSKNILPCDFRGPAMIGKLVCNCSGAAVVWTCSQPQIAEHNGMCIPLSPRKWMDGPLKRLDGTTSEERYIPLPQGGSMPIRRDGIVLCENCPHRMVAEKYVAPLVWQPQPSWDQELRFIRNDDLTNATMDLIPQLPSDVIGVIGIPVSGMMPAAILSRMLCVPLYSFDYKEGVVGVGDGRRSRSVSQKEGVYVVVDDTVYTGGEMKKARAALQKMDLKCIYAAVYARDPRVVDIYSIHAPGSIILEWNIFNSGTLAGRTVMPECRGGICTDFDGVICEEPPVSDLRKPDEFQWWLANARPQYLPRKNEVPLIVSFRIEPWRAVTEAWMARWGVRTRKLVLHPAQTIGERNRTHNVAKHKGELFRDSPCGLMFESDPQQAQIIADTANKPVIVPTTGKIHRARSSHSGASHVTVTSASHKRGIPSERDDLREWFDPAVWKKAQIIESMPIRETRQSEIKLYAIVSTWHEADIVEAAVKNCFAHGCDKVFIVDNDSPDGTREIAVAAGAEIAVNFHTDFYQEQVRLGHINKVMHKVTKEECIDKLWWLTVDCDEFIQVPGGGTLKDYLERIDSCCNTVGCMCLDHYPSDSVANVPGFHPAEFQPMGWFRKTRAFCSNGHWKHPLICFEYGDANMVQTRGLHIPFARVDIHESGLSAPVHGLWLHHFPFRNEAETRQRLGILCTPNKSLGGVHRSIPDDKQLGGEGAIKRYRSLDHIYAYEWDKIEVPHAQTLRKKRGLDVVHWSKIISESEYKPLRWYAQEELDAAIQSQTGKIKESVDAARVTEGLSLTQFLCFEVGSKCNLDKQHEGRCPSADASRYGLMDVSQEISDDMIVECVKYAYANGFAGEIGWHYYNEPLLQWQRIKSLIGRIRSDVPESRFILWTNGTQIPDPVSVAELSVFEDVWVSNYFNKDWKAIMDGYPGRLHILDGKLDGRKALLTIATDRRCMRPYNEIVIDNHGNMHLCCADWKGEAGIGNVITGGFESVLAKFMQVRSDVASQPMRSGVPQICRTCTIRETVAGNLVPDVHARIKSHV